MVVVDPGAEERELVAHRDVALGERPQLAHELELGQRRLEVELPAEPHAVRDVPEELLDGLDADGRQHLAAVGVGEREVGVRSRLVETAGHQASASSAR